LIYLLFEVTVAGALTACDQAAFVAATLGGSGDADIRGLAGGLLGLDGLVGEDIVLVGKG